MLSNSPLTSSPRSVVPQPAWLPCRVFQLTTILIAPVFFGLAPAPVNAASQITCNNYMTDAFRKAQDAIRLGCGFSGPVWSTDGLGHKTWCQGANEDFRCAREARTR